MSMQERFEDLLFGPGYCQRCKLIKPLAMVAIPGAKTDPESGDLEGGMLHLDPHDDQRTGYCRDCALIVAEEWNKAGKH